MSIYCKIEKDEFHIFKDANDTNNNYIILTLESVINLLKEAGYNIIKSNEAFELFRYHTLAARATIYPDKSLDEVLSIIDSLKINFK
jgi:hypothetical protein